MSAEHEALQRELGVYVLGALDPAARDRLERHLADCEACRDELASLAVLPSMLSRAGVTDAWGTDAPSLAPVMQRLAQQRRRARRATWLLAASASLATLTLLAVVALPRVVVPSGQRQFVGDLSGVTATINERSWGMAVQIKAERLPASDGYVAMAVTDSGHSSYVASWEATGRPVVVEGSCYLKPDEVERLEIRSAPDEEVVAVLRPESG